MYALPLSHENLLAYLQKSRSTEEKFCNSLKKLPNLQHVEQAVSTHRPGRLARAYQQLYLNTGLDLDARHPEEEFSLYGFPKLGNRFPLSALTANITSLKLRRIWVGEQAYTLRIPEQVEHLDIEFDNQRHDCCVLRDRELSNILNAWRLHLGRLKQLKALRLALRDSPIEAERPFRKHSIRSIRRFSISLSFADLLTSKTIDEVQMKHLVNDLESRKNHTQDTTDINRACIQDGPFPKLESLALVNCPVRYNGLLAVCAAYQETLKKLEFHRIFLDHAPHPMSITELIDLCREFAPKLEHLGCSRLLFHHRDSIPDGWPHEGPTGSIYVWEKNGNDHLRRRRHWDIDQVLNGEDRLVDRSKIERDDGGTFTSV